jgi:hypothetical protein
MNSAAARASACGLSLTWIDAIVMIAPALPQHRLNSKR